MVSVVGHDAAAVKRITCRNCAAILEYTPSDVRNFYSGTDYGGGPDGADGFNCPKCKARVITRSW